MKEKSKNSDIIYNKLLNAVRDTATPPMTVTNLFAALGEEGESEAEYAACADMLCRDGEAVFSKKNKLITPEEAGYLRGTFRATSRGFGFVTPDGAELRTEDIFIAPDNTAYAMNGDAVLYTLLERRDNSRGPEGKVIAITTREISEFVGTLRSITPRGKKRRPVFFAEPDDGKLSFTVNIPSGKLNGAHEGDKAVIRITSYQTASAMAEGKVCEVFGDTLSREANYASILHENGIPSEFPHDVLVEAERVSSQPITPEGRLDLRSKLIFTVDSAEAKDLDDAVSLERTEDGWLLGVHIADVSHYVRENTALDAEAIKRGTSVYFTDKVVPMLPEALSNGSCSLNGGVDRYTLSALVKLDKKGKIVSSSFYEAIINSRVRGVYVELNDIAEKGKDSEFFNKYSDLFPETFPDILELYAVLDAKSRARGALELDVDEAKIILGEDGLPVNIVKRERGLFERIIEQFMLCANEAAAEWLFWQEMPCVYRIHEVPSDEKVQTFSAFASNLGLDIKPLRAKNITPVAFQTVLGEAKEKGLGGVVSVVMLRSLMKARYSAVPSPHFGLGIEKYCHFTSPIRRYPDTSTHRIIKAVLSGNTGVKRVKALSAFAERSAKLSSDNELRALTAERAIDDLYKTLYMQKFVGEECEGVIGSVTSFGFFVTLENTCEGLVRLSTLDGYFDYDEHSLSLTCGLRRYTLGDRVRVRVTRADALTRKVDMELIEKL